jgi:hypothetical protein
VDNSVLLIAGVLIGAFVLWELMHEWRTRRDAHHQRVRRDAEARRALAEVNGAARRDEKSP